MKSIAINDIQNNSTFFNNLLEAVEVIDQHQKRILAVVYPVHKNQVVQKLAGKYKNRVSTASANMETIKEMAMQMAMAEKYGNFD